MQSGWTVRVASHDDIREIVRITNSAYLVESFCIQGERTNVEDVRSRMQVETVLVIEDALQKSILRAAVFMSITDGRGYFGPLSVDPSCQGKGLAKALILAVEDKCRLAGCSFVDITVVNLRRELFPFYAKLSYSPSAILPFPRPGKVIKALHLIQMTKPLYPAQDL